MARTLSGAYAIVMSSSASKIEFSSAAANDGCFAHIQLSRKLAAMSVIGASDWILPQPAILTHQRAPLSQHGPFYGGEG